MASPQIYRDEWWSVSQSIRSPKKKPAGEGNRPCSQIPLARHRLHKTPVLWCNLSSKYFGRSMLQCFSSFVADDGHHPVPPSTEPGGPLLRTTHAPRRSIPGMGSLHEILFFWATIQAEYLTDQTRPSTDQDRVIVVWTKLLVFNVDEQGEHGHKTTWSWIDEGLRNAFKPWIELVWSFQLGIAKS